MSSIRCFFLCPSGHKKSSIKMFTIKFLYGSLIFSHVNKIHSPTSYEQRLSMKFYESHNLTEAVEKQFDKFSSYITTRRMKEYSNKASDHYCFYSFKLKPVIRGAVNDVITIKWRHLNKTNKELIRNRYNKIIPSLFMNEEFERVNLLYIIDEKDSLVININIPLELLTSDYMNYMKYKLTNISKRYKYYIKLDNSKFYIN